MKNFARLMIHRSGIKREIKRLELRIAELNEAVKKDTKSRLFIERSSQMRALKICLWITGIVCLLSVVGLFLPLSAFESIAGFFGIETLPDSPLIMYAIRMVAATYIGTGVFFIILALNPAKYGVLVPFSGLAAIFIGVVCVITGLAVGMPAPWFLGDFLSCAVPGVLIFVFWRQTK